MNKVYINNNALTVFAYLNNGMPLFFFQRKMPKLKLDLVMLENVLEFQELYIMRSLINVLGQMKFLDVEYKVISNNILRCFELVFELEKVTSKCYTLISMKKLHIY